MVITLDLPRSLEVELAAEAAELGLSLQDYVLRVLATGRPPGRALRTGAEVVGYWRREGLIGTHPDIADSQEHARAIRSRAERRSHA